MGPCRRPSRAAGSREAVQRLLGVFFLSVLFVLFWDFTWEEETVERELWKVFGCGLPLLPLKQEAKLLLSSVGAEASAEHLSLFQRCALCGLRNGNVQLS